MELFVKYALVGFYVLGILSIIVSIGRERKPTTPTLAAVSVALNGLVIFAILHYWK
jgi:uncharacterized protein with PQ loop repeat